MNGAGTSYTPLPSSPVGNTAMRQCTGGCRKRRSIGQFVGKSTVCIRCVRRGGA